jgi:hypothetical protein
VAGCHDCCLQIDQQRPLEWSGLDLLVCPGALGFAEVWEDGPVLRDLAARQAALQRSREDVEAARKVRSPTGVLVRCAGAHV